MIEAGQISTEEAEMAETARDLMTEGCARVNSGEPVADGS
jgi:hypothetical protein